MYQKILVIDDDQELCVLIRKFLEIENYSVEVSHDGESGLKRVQDSEFSLIILDVMLPKMNGFDVLTQLRKTIMTPVLMLTAKDSEVDKVSGLRLGADDYLTKPFSMNEFVARVQALLRRYTMFGGNLSTPVDEKLCLNDMVIDPSTREVMIQDKLIDLTAKEFDLLYFLAKNKGKVFTKKQIYHAVWEEDYAFDDNNIMVHIRRLRKKIEEFPEEPKYIQTVWGVGYKFGGGKV